MSARRVSAIFKDWAFSAGGIDVVSVGILLGGLVGLLAVPWWFGPLAVIRGFLVLWDCLQDKKAHG